MALWVPFVAFVTLAGLVSAEPFAAPEGWIDQRAKLVSPESAERVVAQREQTLAQERDRQAERQHLLGATAAPRAAAEITPGFPA